MGAATMDSQPRQQSATWAVVVTYHPEPDQIRRLLSDLQGQVAQVIVVDNGSGNTDRLLSACQGPGVLVRALPTNVGIAHAQNVGVATARQAGARYVIYFDQDSAIPPGFVGVLEQAFLALASNHKLAATVPVFQDSRYGFFYPLIVLEKFGLRRKIVPDGTEREPFPISLAISSGTLTSLAVLDDVGHMRDDFFIDYVDTEWCLRALSKGYVLYAVPRARMLHAIGERAIRVWKWRLVVHSAVRRYYRIRNGFFMLRLGHVPLLLGLREVVLNCAMQAVFIVTQKDRWLNLKSLATGIRHGLGKFNRTSR